jgi:hypothetical protein
LSKVILLGNVVLFPRDTDVRREGPVQCRERLGGLLRYYQGECSLRRALKEYVEHYHVERNHQGKDQEAA